ncbi:hypothetical protein DQ04_01231020 [Trypanosoma grayi]|uniref:hypothetical protein n=1 Tax=Trypanosoma grayi TaxID=71804 RepID=UPI0004F4BAF9|nr:hypothetical protein DQ04_01231020 [Trypanosoma grayi]KEG13067.1 hypothetical protein DQ04_01231020 [Trypanosoma grayi]
MLFAAGVLGGSLFRCYFFFENGAAQIAIAWLGFGKRPNARQPCHLRLQGLAWGKGVCVRGHGQGELPPIPRNVFRFWPLWLRAPPCVGGARSLSGGRGRDGWPFGGGVAAHQGCCRRRLAGEVGLLLLLGAGGGFAFCIRMSLSFCVWGALMDLMRSRL